MSIERPQQNPRDPEDVYTGDILLVTKAELDEHVIDGTELIDVYGKRHIQGVDSFGLENWTGFTSFGFPVDKIPNWLPQEDRRRMKVAPRNLKR